jgi:hypothetical protein
MLVFDVQFDYTGKVEWKDVLKSLAALAQPVYLIENCC